MDQLEELLSRELKDIDQHPIDKIHQPHKTVDKDGYTHFVQEIKKNIHSGRVF
jgi:anthranilate/para-aminobenzoate synthase component I